ncbi:unnamed protein product [Paramecium pentaurelia]|uniref:Cullin family profile domain-containing protein n=1 Tax=Paramecium pentaurelia TaxID=43138 RepID=A0A8S1YPZ9_9CILI|nr:unnamed protein product [Paramecium pentaurelia]
MIHLPNYFEQKGQLLIIPLIINNKQIKKLKLNSISLIYQNQSKKLKIFLKLIGKRPEVKNFQSKLFMYLINKHEKSPNQLAIYIDIIIRREKERNEIEADKMLTQIDSLFQLLYLLDIFFQHYYKLLPKSFAQFLVIRSITREVHFLKIKI